MKRITIVAGLATALVISLGMLAQAAPQGEGGKGGKDGKKPGGKRPDPVEIFKKLNTAGDGNLTLEELKAGPMGQKVPDRVPQIFEKMDADGSGGVSQEEFVAAHKKRAEHAKGGKGKGKGEGKGKGKGDKKEGGAAAE